MQLDRGIGIPWCQWSNRHSGLGGRGSGDSINRVEHKGNIDLWNTRRKTEFEAPNLLGLIEMIPGLVMCALPDGSAEFANRAWQEFTGCSLERLTGRGWQTVIHPDDVTKFNGEWSRISDSKKTVRDRSAYAARRRPISLDFD